MLSLSSLTLFLAIGSTHVPSLTSSLHSYPSVGTYCVDPSVVGNARIKSIFLSVFIVINLCFQCFIVVFPLVYNPFLFLGSLR